jgi:hypothetical protein
MSWPPKIEDVTNDGETAVLFMDDDAAGLMVLQDFMAEPEVDVYRLWPEDGGTYSRCSEHDLSIPISAFLEMARKVVGRSMERALWALESDGDPAGAMAGLIACLGHDPTTPKASE